MATIVTIDATDNVGDSRVDINSNFTDINAEAEAATTKLAGIEAGATVDQTGAEIKVSYENEADTNAYTDAEKTKLAGIEASADVNTIDSDPTGITGADQVTNVVSLIQAEYDAIATPDASTLYFITDAT